MNGPINVSVIVCTYNRSRILGATIESIVAQAFPQSLAWEILVIDNNSTDETRQVVDHFRCRYPERIRYLFEPLQGISYARNTGVREARGEILAFIDDDETADADWLQNLTANLHSGEWAGAGGPVLPRWNGPRPSWLAADSPFTLGPLAAWQPDSGGTQLTAPPVGANMAYRKDAFDRYGGFRTDLGRVGLILLHGEDTEFGRRLMDAGQRLCYEPSAIIHHPVDDARAKKQYFVKWWFNKGRSDVREVGNHGNGISFLSSLLGLCRNIAVEAVRWTVASSPSPRFICTLKICAYVGQGYESYLLRFGVKRKGARRNASIRPPAGGQ